MDPLPTGTVTMLFSDIEGSTALLSRLGKRYGEALSTQRSIMRSAIESWSGREMGTEGDSFFVVFETAHCALSACLQAQRALATCSWPDDTAVRVRMGVHTGEPTRHEEGYIGMDLNRAARIAATAHGGQVVVSRATGRLVSSGLAADVRLADLGWHRLKDIDEPEQIFQLVAPDLPADFPPLKSLGAQSSLPLPTTPLLGRADELQELRDAVMRPEVRLVTLLGPGGVGKTRLALALAASLDTTFEDGVYFVPLATVSSADVMWKALADALGAGTEIGPDSAVTQLLAGRTALLVLDNLEQLEHAAEVIATLIAAAPDLVVIATSRRPMHLQGEREFPVQPLAGPTGETLDNIAASAAVALFMQHAVLVRRGFSLTADNADDVAAICVRLDGLPLAIELAASRVKLLSPKALLARLGNSLDLAANEVDRPSRQQTLRTAIAWSHDLLNPELQQVFRRLGVFAGGCDLDAVTAVIVDPNAPSGGPDALDAVTDLLDLSLITVNETPESDIRVSMLETIREYAHAQLVLSGEQETTHRLHADYYADFAEQASAELHGSRQLIWLNRLEIEHDNLRAALSWTLEHTGSEADSEQQRRALGMRLVNALSWFWYGHSHIADGRRWLELAIDQATGDEGPTLADALHGLGWLLVVQGDTGRAKAVLEQNLDLCRRLGDPLRLAQGLDSLGIAYRDMARHDVARRLIAEALTIARSQDSDAHIARALRHLAIVDMETGDPDHANALLTEAIDIAIRLDDSYTVAVCRHNLASNLNAYGRPAEAHDLMCSLVDDILGFGDLEMVADTLGEFAECAAALGDDRRAARISGAEHQLREQIGLKSTTAAGEYVDRTLGPARERLGRDAWDAEYAAGRQLTQADALELARRPLTASR